MKALPAAAELLTLSAIELSHRLQSREVKAVDLMKTTLERIDEVNPKVNAIIALPKGKPLRFVCWKLVVVAVIIIYYINIEYLPITFHHHKHNRS